MTINIIIGIGFYIALSLYLGIKKCLDKDFLKGELKNSIDGLDNFLYPLWVSLTLCLIVLIIGFMSINETMNAKLF